MISATSVIAATAAASAATANPSFSLEEGEEEYECVDTPPPPPARDATVAAAIEEGVDDDDDASDDDEECGRGSPKRPRVEAQEVIFASAPTPAGGQVMLPLRLVRKAHQLPCNVPAVQVQYENISATQCTPRVWAALTRRLRTLLVGSSGRSNKRPRSGKKQSLLANVMPVDVGSAGGLEVVKTAYGSAQNSDYSAVDTSRMLLFKVSWPAEETYPSAPDCAHILLDETGDGAGVALVYGRAAMYFQGPAQRPDTADSDDEAPALYRRSTVGEMRGFTPMAACLLRMFCDIICRVSWGSKQRMAGRVCLRVLLNTPANDHVMDMYRQECKAFSEAAMAALFAVTAKPKKSSESAAAVVAAVLPAVTHFVQTLAPPPPLPAAPFAGLSAPALVAAPRPRDPLPVAAIASLCDTIRRKNLPSETVDARVLFWCKVAKVQLPPPAPTTYGMPGYSHAVENALGRMVATIAHLGWDEELVNMAESQMMQMMTVRL